LSDIVYFHISKASDTVSHPKLIQKHKAYGFRGNLIGLIADFISGRPSEYVYRMGRRHDTINGFSRDSVLGPPLFLLCINDIVSLFIGSVSLKPFGVKIYVYTEVRYYGVSTPRNVLTTLLLGLVHGN